MFKLLINIWGRLLFWGRLFTCFWNFPDPKKMILFFFRNKYFFDKKSPPLPEIIKIPIKCLKSLIFSGETLKNIKKKSPPKPPPNIISGRLFNNPFSFSKNMKIISEKNENQLFFIPLICIHLLTDDFQKSNFIFSKDQSEKSENQ